MLRCTLFNRQQRQTDVQQHKLKALPRPQSIYTEPFPVMTRHDGLKGTEH